MEIIALSCASALVLMITHFLEYLGAMDVSDRPAWHAMPLEITPVSLGPFAPVRRSAVVSARV
jgi:hypothetical protein